MTNPPITKKCAVCGIEKPLTAFLTLQTQTGTQYGNICANCRKMQTPETAPITKDIDETDGTVDRHTIDSKAKVAIERDKQQQQKEKEEREQEETEHELEEKTLELEKKATRTQDEKKHRKEIFETLLIKRPPTKAEEKNFIQKKLEEKNKQLKETQQKESQKQEKERQEQERIQKEVNEVSLTNPLVGPTDRLKYQSVVFRQFLATVGEGSAIARNVSRLQQQSEQQKFGEPNIEELTKHIQGPIRKK